MPSIVQMCRWMEVSRSGFWATGDNYKTPLIERAIEMAARNCPLAENAIFHSDRGSNYTSQQFAGTLKKYNLRQSVGRTGICSVN
ncbi:MAG: DDE-type integrase/transposase/recombinase [Streptosporangiaceae bacterium]